MKIAYLTSLYPALSHTFIRREVAALRRRGLEIDTMSVRPVEPADLSFEEDREEAARTWTILPVGVWKLLRTHGLMLLSHPLGYGAALGLAATHRVPGVRAAFWALLHFGEAVLLAAELEARDVRHLHTHFGNSGGTVGLLAARLLGIEWSLSVHGSKAEFDYPAAPLLGAKVRAAAFVRCVSRFGSSQLMRRSDPRDWRKLFVARCGVDVASLPALAEPPRRAEGPRRVVTVGRLVPEKGHQGLLEAFRWVAERREDVELTIVGEGADRQRLEEHAATLALESRVHLPGARSEPDVLRLVAEADVFALGSLIEGLPVVLMEAMALGTPVVAPRLSGIPELVEHERTGLLFTPGDWSELATGIERLLEDPELGEGLRQAARVRVEEDFDVSRAVEPLWKRFLEGEPS